MTAPLASIYPDEILAEHTLGESLTGDVLAALIGEGVDMAAICRRVERGALDPPRLDRVVLVADLRFEFARHRHGDNRGAMTFVCRDEIGDPIDMAAWSPPRPVALWLGRAAMLGAENLFGPRMTEGLAVHASPLEWLRAACRGVVVVDPERARGLLHRAQPLEVASIAHGRELRRVMEVKPPKILVSRGLRKAA
jgi:hypothetical protein